MQSFNWLVTPWLLVFLLAIPCIFLYKKSLYSLLLSYIVVLSYPLFMNGVPLFNKSEIGRSLLSILCSLGIAFTLRKRLPNIFALASLVGTILSLFDIWLLGNGSLTQIFLVATAPFVMKYTKLYYPLLLLSMLIHFTSQGFMVCLLLGFIAIPIPKKSIKWILLPLIGIVSLVVIYQFFPKLELTNDNGRFERYTRLIKSEAEEGKLLIGYGTGSFMPEGIRIQEQSIGKIPTEYYYFAHSEIVQIIFEWGLAGLVLVLVLFFKGVINLDLLHARVLILYVAGSVFNSPARIALSGLLAAYLFVKIIESDHNIKFPKFYGGKDYV